MVPTWMIVERADTWEPWDRPQDSTGLICDGGTRSDVYTYLYLRVSGRPSGRFGDGPRSVRGTERMTNMEACDDGSGGPAGGRWGGVMRALVLVSALAPIFIGCSSSKTSERCFELQRQCIEAERCLESRNAGQTSGQGQYGDQTGVGASDEASCDVRCVPCGAETGSGGDESSGGEGGSTGGTSASNGGAGGAPAGGSSGVSTYDDGACGLVAFSRDCTTCLEAEDQCCAAALACADEPDCATTWACYQDCEASGEWCGACAATPERARSVYWSHFASCVNRQCNGGERPACPGLGT